MEDYQDAIKKHYQENWNIEPEVYFFDRGPANQLPYGFRVLEFPPSKDRSMWTYATCCMSQENDISKIELHLFSSIKDTSLIELLTVVAHYHRTGENIGLNHTINFGRPWQENSSCDHGFISLPYMDGPDLEIMPIEKGKINFYWLIPITKREKEFKVLNGAEALEEAFEEEGFDYLNPYRKSVV